MNFILCRKKHPCYFCCGFLASEPLTYFSLRIQISQVIGKVSKCHHISPFFWRLKFACCCLVAKSCPTFWHPMDCAQAPLCMGFPRQEYWISQARILKEMGWHFLLQGIFLTQGLNLGLLHCRLISYRLNHKGSRLCILEATHSSFGCYSGSFTQWSEKPIALSGSQNNRRFCSRFKLLF